MNEEKSNKKARKKYTVSGLFEEFVKPRIHSDYREILDPSVRTYIETRLSEDEVIRRHYLDGESYRSIAGLPVGTNSGNASNDLRDHEHRVFCGLARRAITIQDFLNYMQSQAERNS